MLKSLKLQPNQKQGLINKIKADIRLDIAYIGLSLISSLIATFALLIDDIAVLIGAMLIAPFLSPALGVSMGLIKGDINMFKKGLITLLAGVVVGIIASIIITGIYPIRETTPAIMDRSAPTLVQLIIALLAGAAAAFSYAHRRVRAVLSGAFVALALVPPISIIGIGITFWNWEIVGGASLLLAANVIGLSLAAVIIFFVFGFRPINQPKTLREFRVGITWLAGLFLIIALPLGYIMQTIIIDINQKNTVEKVAQKHIDQNYNTQIENIFINKEGEKYKVKLTIRSSSDIDTQKIRNIKDQLERSWNRPVELDAHLIPTYKIDY
jgi:uncharacterized hydrophobic protein (TIGR00271 family)